jgi:hypothetical protein
VIGYLVSLAAVSAAFAAYGLGRFIERRVWERQRSEMFALLSEAGAKIDEMRAAEAVGLEVVAAQRSLLEIVAHAYETGEWEGWHPSGYRINRIAWVATQARQELL